METAVAFLSGYARQGRIGVGYAALRDAAAPAADRASLETGDVDRALDGLVAVRGRGAEEKRREWLHGLLERATEAEQRFLTALLLGEIRQGALEGVMIEALAKASGASAGRVRRAAMMAGDAVRVARAAMERGEAGLVQYLSLIHI